MRRRPLPGSFVAEDKRRSQNKYDRVVTLTLQVLENLQRSIVRIILRGN